METSILTSTKKVLGVPEDYTAFDLDILTFVNSAFSTITQLGIGPVNGIFIEDSIMKWEDLDLSTPQVSQVRSYIFLQTKMLFDPPATSYVLDAMQRQIDEHVSRLSYMRENDRSEIVEDPEIPVVGESATGAVVDAAYVWIINHDLHFFPAAVKCYELESDDEIEPEEVQYINNNQILALWPVPTAGRWRVS